MTFQIVDDMQQAAVQLSAVKAEALKEWQSACDCANPGTTIDCITCPTYRILVQKMQEQLESNDAKSSIPKLIPPPLLNSQSEGVRQQCCQLFELGYSLDEIQWMLGSTSLRTMRKWLRQAGLMGGCGDYDTQQKQHCLALYERGLTPRQVEAETRVPADVISTWASQAGIVRPKSIHNYSDKQRQECLDLYMAGNSNRTVANLTAIPIDQVKTWIKESGLKRPRIKGGGRRKVYSQEFRAECLNLLAQGQTATQVGMAKGLSADTIRQWRKEAAEQSSSENKSIEPAKPCRNQQKPDNARQPAAGTSSKISTTSQQPRVQQLNLFEL